MVHEGWHGALSLHRERTDRAIFLIVIDEDRNVFSVEGPMTDKRHWQVGAPFTRNHHDRVVQAGADRIGMSRPRFRQAVPQQRLK